MNDETSVWKGSAYTAQNVAMQIKSRFGEEAVKEYDPRLNCFTFRRWQEEGYRVKKGEKSLRSLTFIPIEKKDARGQLKVVKIPRTVHLFFINQVEKISA